MPGTTARFAVGVFAAALVFAGCGEGAPAIETDAAEAELATVASSADGSALTDCPVEDADLILEQLFADTDDDVIELALAGSAVAAVTDQPVTLACGRTDQSGSATVAISLADAPGDGIVDPDAAVPEFDVGAQWAATADAYATRSGDAPPELAVRELQDTRGGVLYEICLADEALPDRSRCELAWFGGDLVVSVAVAGPGSDDVDLQPVIDPFRRRLQLIVDGLSAS